MRAKKIISLVVSVCMLMTFIPLQAMAETGTTATVAYNYDSHGDEYVIMNGDEEILSGEEVLIGTELKIVPTATERERYIINGFWLYYDDYTPDERIDGDSFIVTEDVEIYDVELSYVVGKNDGDIWVIEQEFYLWESYDVDESGRIDSYDFLTFYEDLILEPLTMDDCHTITSKGVAVNRNIYVIDEGYLYFGDLNLGTGGVYGYSYEIGDEYESDTYYPDINLNKGKLIANNIHSEGNIQVYPDNMNLYVKQNIVCRLLDFYGGTIVVDGDIISSQIWIGSDNGPLYVTVGGNIKTIWFAHGGGYVHVKNSIIADYNEDLFDSDMNDSMYGYEQPYIIVGTQWTYGNPTDLVVDDDITAGEEGFIVIDEEWDDYNYNYFSQNMSMTKNPSNDENESAIKPRKNKDNGSDNRMLLASDEDEEFELYVEVYAGGNIEAGMEISIHNGTVIAEGSIKTTNEETYRTIYIYGGDVKCNEMQSATGIEIYDTPMGTSVEVTGDMTAEESICMFRNPYLYVYEYDDDTPGFIDVNVGGDIVSGRDVIIGVDIDSDSDNILGNPMFINVNASNVKSGDRIIVFGSISDGEFVMPYFNKLHSNLNVDGDMSASNMIGLLNSDVFVGGKIVTEALGDGKDLLVGIAGSIVRCGSIESAADIFIDDSDGLNDVETLVYVNGNMIANGIIEISSSKVYSSGVSAGNELVVDDYATLFDAVNNNEQVIPINQYSTKLFRTTLSGLVPNATVEIHIENEKYYKYSQDHVKSFTTDADNEGNIYVWLLGDETIGTAYYGIETLATSPTAITSDGAELKFRPLDAKLAEISMDIPDVIFNMDTGNPWNDYEDENHPFNPANWIFEYDGNNVDGFSEYIEDYSIVFTRYGQLYDFDDIGGFLAGDYKVTVSTEQKIGEETYIAVGTDVFTIEPWVITVKADDKELLKGSEIDEDFFTISYSDNAGWVEDGVPFIPFGEFEFVAICNGNTDKVETYPIYVKPSSYDDYNFFMLIMKIIFDDSMQIELKDGAFIVYEESPEEPEEPTRRSSTTYYTITARAGEGGTISPDGSVRVARRSDKTFKITADEGYVIKDVLVNGESIGSVDSYTFENVKGDAAIEVIFSSVEPEEWQNPFNDVNENDWFYDAVKFCVRKDLFAGMTENSFEPDTSVTRAMFVTVLGRLTGINPEDYNSQVFDDVEPGQWYSPYVQWAFENEIIKGYDEKVFGPNDRITREQMCSIIVRYCEFAGLELEELIGEAAFDDDDLTSLWAKEYIRKSQMAELIKGVGNNMFNPRGNATRAEAAAILMRLIQNVIE